MDIMLIFLCVVGIAIIYLIGSIIYDTAYHKGWMTGFDKCKEIHNIGKSNE